MFSVMLRAREEGLPLPSCGWSVSPWADMEGRGTWRAGTPGRDPLLSVGELDYFIDVYLNGKNLRHPGVAPIYGDLSGLPPVLIQVGGDEILLDDARTLARGMREAGSEVVLHEEKGAAHVWHHMVPDVPEAVAAIEQGAEFIRHHTP